MQNKIFPHTTAKFVCGIFKGDKMKFYFPENYGALGDGKTTIHALYSWLLTRPKKRRRNGCA